MTGPHRSDPELVALHTLRCGGATSMARLAAAVGPVVTVDLEEVVLGLAAQGLVAHASEPFDGWRLTDEGRRTCTERVTAELEQAGARPHVRSAYRDFLALNPRTLEICSDWQVRSRDPLVLNDHTDRTYDAQVLRRLATVDASVQRVCVHLSARLHRFSHYGPRLGAALHRAMQGDARQVADALDSYHTVWFQLHEDLLVTLGRERQGPP